MGPVGQWGEVGEALEAVCARRFLGDHDGFLVLGGRLLEHLETAVGRLVPRSITKTDPTSAPDQLASARIAGAPFN